MKVLIGNLFESEAETLVNTVNCVGVMGKGIAKEFKSRYPGMFAEYRQLCESGEVKPGRPYAYFDLLGVRVVNFPTKDHWRSSSKLSYVVDGLEWFRRNYETLEISSVAFPPLGCGNGGLDWGTVGPVMYSMLHDLPIEVEIYAPYGTPEFQLTEDYLKQPRKINSSNVEGAPLSHYDSRWDAVLFVMRQLELASHALPIGRTVYQKICYMMTREGVELGFAFSPREYGPFSKEAREALRIMANCNKIRERSVGQMIRVEIVDDAADNFEGDEVTKNASSRVADLFSRLNDAQQAEEVATIVYCHDQLADLGAPVVEADLLDSILAWKPHWRPADMIDALKRDICYLTAFGWISVDNPSYDASREYVF